MNFKSYYCNFFKHGYIRSVTSVTTKVYFVISFPHIPMNFWKIANFIYTDMITSKHDSDEDDVKTLFSILLFICNFESRRS
jgi:hypothetical protein